MFFKLKYLRQRRGGERGGGEVEEVENNLKVDYSLKFWFFEFC